MMSIHQRRRFILKDTKRIDCEQFVHDSVCDGYEGGSSATPEIAQPILASDNAIRLTNH